MTPPRDDRGRFRPGDDDFITITNEKIYEQLIAQGEVLGRLNTRIRRIEDRMAWNSRLWTSLTTVIIAGSALISGVYYAQR